MVDVARRSRRVKGVRFIGVHAAELDDDGSHEARRDLDHILPRLLVDRHIYYLARRIRRDITLDRVVDFCHARPERRLVNDPLRSDRLEHGEVEMKRVGVGGEVYHFPDLRASYDRLLRHRVIKSLTVNV